MSFQHKTKRLTLILEKVRSIKPPTLEDILTHLNDNDFKCSERTLRRDLSVLRNDFGIEIVCNNHNKYTIDAENSPDLNSYLHFFEIVNTASLIIENLKGAKNQNIQYDKEGGLKGIDNLSILLKAINDHNEITFIHTNFIKGTKKERILKPYLLKEYLNRWYIVGVDHNNNLRNFAIDRITNIKCTDTFTPIALNIITDQYYNVIGLENSDAQFKEIKTEEIILSFNKIQGKYIKSLPLHHSQEVILENEKELQIKLWLKPNYELKQRILMYGCNVKVVQPKHLANQIKQELKKAIKQY